jgi:Phytanoyl-CoA dioxygenase (PhyH)
MSQTHARRDATATEALPAPTDVGMLGVFQLKRAWTFSLMARQGKRAAELDEAHLNHLVYDALGLGFEQTLQYLAQHAPTFDEFERWIVSTTGGVAATQIARINAAVTNSEYPPEIKCRLAEIDRAEPVLCADDLAFWDEHGYVILHDAVAPDTRAAATQAILDHLGACLDDPESWYGARTRSIMVQYFQHPAFDANRRSPRIHKAFSQLWGTSDLWVTTDRVGFNVPERPGWQFPGPHLHWDTSLRLPMPLNMQGILYLTDTPPEQGAFTCVPGFHRRLADWLASLPAGADPRTQDLHALGSRPIGGRAGDLVIWNDALPHGSSPNSGRMPRIVQYIKMYPTKLKTQAVWI